MDGRDKPGHDVSWELQRLGAASSTTLTTAKPRARYACCGKFFNWTLPLLLPKRTLDRIIARALGLTRRR